MKASEVIEKLAAMIRERGDIPVVFYDERAEELVEVEEVLGYVGMHYQDSDMEMHDGPCIEVRG